MPKRPLIFISEPIHQAGMSLLDDNFEIILAPDTTRATTLQLIKYADAAILRATTIFDSDVISTAQNLRIIARTGIGVNNVDLKAAGDAGIYVCNATNANVVSVAEHTLAMVLCLAKQTFVMDNAVREQNWAARYSSKQMEIKGKTIGLIGFGSIGKATAKLCHAVGMKVRVYNRSGFIDDPNIQKAISLYEIFVSCDFISLHCPSSIENYHMVNKELIQLMRSNAYFINTSRVDLLDELALSVALNGGKIAGAALDVFENEPLTSASPLLSACNLILSPHVAGATKESDERLAVIAAQAVLDTMQGKKPLNIVNSAYLKTSALLQINKG